MIFKIALKVVLIGYKPALRVRNDNSTEISKKYI